MTNDTLVLFTLAVGDPRAVYVPGQTVGSCDRCGRPVNVSPSTTELIAKQPATILSCINCMKPDERAEILKAVASGVSTKVQIDPTPAQADEIGRHFSAGNN